MSYSSINLLTLYIDEAAAVRLLIVLNIILISIILLWFIIRILVPLIRKMLTERKEKDPGKIGIAETTAAEAAETGLDAEAAIATALYLYFNEMHDEESDIITVTRVSKTYSPWSSKLYSMRNLR